MIRLTEKNKIFGYVLPCANVVGDNQASEINLSRDEYIFHRYIVGEAIRKFGELEDILEKYGIESVEDFDSMINSILRSKEK